MFDLEKYGEDSIIKASTVKSFKFDPKKPKEYNFDMQTFLLSD